MTVEELKEYLKDIPNNYSVTVEGCDCEALATGIVIDNSLEEIMIARYTNGVVTQNSSPALTKEINIWRNKKNI